MGEVYKARDTRLDRTVAIKVLPSHLAGRPELKQRFEREAKAISSLTHPNICTLYDIGHEGDIDYLVMEHLEGRRSPTSSPAGRCRRSRSCATASRSPRRSTRRTGRASFIAISSPATS
jgi:hypothetical protein